VVPLLAKVSNHPDVTIASRLRVGNAVMVLLVALNVGLYGIAAAMTSASLDARQVIAEIFSSSAMILLSCSIILSYRTRSLERLFGGLDRVYQTHRTTGVIALALLFTHFFTIPKLSEPDSLGRTLGKLALIGLTSLVALALVPRIPVIGGFLRLAYDQWRTTHRFIGAFFILGFVHMLSVSTITRELPLARWYWQPIAVIGMAAYLYKELIASRRTKRTGAYVVTTVNHLNPSVVEIGLEAKARSVSYRAGQFAFLSFPGDRILKEEHPFTISSAPSDEELRFSVKASGDWTRYLFENVQPGLLARIDGGWGGFSYTRGEARQIWVAGGIGVTPFLSWIRECARIPPGRDISLFYSVRARNDAVHWSEIETAARRGAIRRAFLSVSSEEGHLSPGRMLAEAGGSPEGLSVHLCGPYPMMDALRGGFRRLGVPAQRIFAEEFSLK
jgi:predicted ferric reductase